MSVSEKFGALPFLSFVWDHGPIAAAFIVLLADFGIVFALMALEAISPEAPMPWKRTHYYSFLWGDTIFLPLYAAGVVFVLRNAQPLDGFYTSQFWHLALLAGGFALSIFIEVGALKNGQYTMSQEFSPSKLYHTFIFGVMFYWIASTLIPVIVVHRPVWAVALAMLGIAGFFWMGHLDATTPLPKDTHTEGTWEKWNWHVRS